MLITTAFASFTVVSPVSHLYVCMYVCMYVCKYLCVCTRMYVYVCTYVCVCVHVGVVSGHLCVQICMSDRILPFLRYLSHLSFEICHTCAPSICRFWDTDICHIWDTHICHTWHTDIYTEICHTCTPSICRFWDTCASVERISVSFNCARVL